MHPVFLYDHTTALLGTTGPQADALQLHCELERASCGLILYTQHVYKDSDPALGIDPKRLEAHLLHRMMDIPKWWGLSSERSLKIILDDEVLRWDQILGPKRTYASLAADALRVGRSVQDIKEVIYGLKPPYPVEVGVYGRPYRAAGHTHQKWAYDGLTMGGCIGADIIAPACYQTEDESSTDYARRFDDIAHAAVHCIEALDPLEKNRSRISTSVVWNPVRHHVIDPLTRLYQPIPSICPHLSLDGKFRIGREVLPSSLKYLFIWMAPRWRGSPAEPGWTLSGWPTDQQKSLQLETLLVDDIVRSMSIPDP